jgi:hypothetical protein
VPEPVVHVRFALLAGRIDGRNTVFDWYGPQKTSLRLKLKKGALDRLLFLWLQFSIAVLN